MSYLAFEQNMGVLEKFVPSETMLRREIKYGITADVKFDIKADFETTFKRKNALFTNIMTANGFLNARVMNDIHCHDGINAAMLDNNGFISADAVSEALFSTGYYKLAIAKIVAPIITAKAYDNCVGLLVNILRWAIVLETDPIKFKIGQNTIYYNDGHVSLTHGRYYKRQWSENFKVNFHNDVSMICMSENYIPDNNFFMPSLANLSAREIGLIAKLSGGIECDYPLRLAFSSPKLTSTLVMPESTTFVRSSDIYDFKSHELHVLLRKFIAANRCEAQFDMAYHIIVSAMLKPVPRSIEANGWVSPVDTINLPTLSSARGLVSVMTAGKPYMPRPDAMLTWSNYCRYPNRIFSHAIAYTESVYAGFFEVMTATSDINEYKMSVIGINSYSDSNPYAVGMGCLAYRTGCKYTMPWTTNSGVSFYGHLLQTNPAQLEIKVKAVGDVEGYKFYDVPIEEGQTDTGSYKFIMATSMRPAIYPLLTMGVNDERFYINSTEYSVELQYRSETNSLHSTSGSAINKAMSILRLGGYDASAIDMYTGIKVKNWASNNDGHWIPEMKATPVNSGAYAIPLSTLRQRNSHWIMLDCISDKLNMSISTKLVGYQISLNGAKQLTFNVAHIPITSMKPVAHESLVNMFVQEIGHDINHSDYNYADFILASVYATEQPISMPSVPLGMIMSRSLEERMNMAGLDPSYLEEEEEAPEEEE